MIRLGIATIAATFVLAFSALAEVTAPEEVKFEEGAVESSISGSQGDPEAGRLAFKDRKLGNCLACHMNSDMKSELFHGEVGPPLDGVGDRWSEAEIRAIVVNSKAVFGDETVMPGFYSLDVGVDVRKDLIGKTILTAQQIEDIVAYLTTLKEE